MTMHYINLLFTYLLLCCCQTELPADINIIKHRCLRNLVSLAEGGFGVVYSAEHEDWGTVAYKELKTTIIKPESKYVKHILH